MRTFIVVLFVTLCLAEDHLLPNTFEELFPNAPKSDVLKLTEQINQQKNPKKAKIVLDNWIQRHWDTIPETTHSEQEATTQQYVTENQGDTDRPKTTRSYYYGGYDGYGSYYGSPSNYYGGYNSSYSSYNGYGSYGSYYGSSGNSNSGYNSPYGSYNGYDGYVNYNGSFSGTKEKQYSNNVGGIFRELIGEKVVTESYAIRIEDRPEGFNAEDYGEKMQPDKWEEDYWVRIIPNPSLRTKRSCSSDKHLVRQKALNFIDHRATLKSLIRFAVNRSLKERVLEKSEAPKMYKLFWDADKESGNEFSHTERNFYGKITMYEWSNERTIVSGIFEGLFTYFRENRKKAELLDWSLDGFHAC
ncbi:Protein CBG27257 [Caenorhabditis briggsae]|uniref:Protein CBG27257 n=1 Tax=Caenorhabditis briggsae TaxID=6238 RepID=B6IFS7_CAEBR|nr:Protein CBG27257 [Caenorhabditis briggsae]CAR98795.1 Protein CBG27257 [Caenorhabditis briggsae]